VRFRSTIMRWTDVGLTDAESGSADGTKFNFATFKTFVEQLRRELSDRQLVSQSFLVSPAPGDKEGLSGSVAHTVKASAVKQGKRIEINIVSVLNVVFDEKLEERRIKAESFVLTETPAA
jgi:hypothetical protein